MKEIEALIPHRDPFLFVDRIISLSEKEVIGTKVFSDTDHFLRGSFPDAYYVPGVILIEAMAQCGGAGIKKMCLADGLFGLASIEHANFQKGVEYGKIFKMVIKNIKVAERYIKQTGIGSVDDELAMEMTWTCVKFQ